MRPKPVVWALDAFSEPKTWDVHFKTARSICRHASDSQIQPVYILSEQTFSDRGYSNFLRPGLKPMARRNLDALLSHDALFELKKSGRLRAPEVIVETTSDAIACVQKLLRYAESIDAGCIAIGTHGRSLVTRLFLGSFAQTLIRESHIPVLVTGACLLNETVRDGNGDSTELVKPNRAVVLPTDFQPDGRSSFEGFLELAAQRNLDVHLFNKQIEPLEDWIQCNAFLIHGGWIPIDERLLDEGEPNAEVELWQRKAREAGVRVHVATAIFRESIADSIIEYARHLEEFSPVIAIMSAPSWLDSSVLRDLVRSSPYPLYVKEFGERRQYTRDETRDEPRENLADGATSFRW